jgi:hypothetical protein
MASTTEEVPPPAIITEDTTDSITLAPQPAASPTTHKKTLKVRAGMWWLEEGVKEEGDCLIALSLRFLGSGLNGARIPPRRERRA